MLALPASAEQKAQASLALTRHNCQDPLLTPSRRLQADLVRALLLDQISDANMAVLPDTLGNRLRLRRAGVWAALAFERARLGQDATSAGQRAVDLLAAVDKAALTDDVWQVASPGVETRDGGPALKPLTGVGGKACAHQSASNASATPPAQVCVSNASTPHPRGFGTLQWRDI